MRKSQGSLAGWLFADLTLVIAVVMLSSWTISQESTSTATVALTEFNLLLSERIKLEAELQALKAELFHEIYEIIWDFKARKIHIYTH